MKVEPTYFLENRYSFVVDALPFLRNAGYEVETPETSFERDVQQELAVANRLLMEGKHSAALAKYRHLRGVVASMVHPDVSITNGSLIDWAGLSKTAVVDTLVARSAEMLIQTPAVASTVPAKLRESEVSLPATVAKQFAMFGEVGVRDHDARVGVIIDGAASLTETGSFDRALTMFQTALRATDDPGLKAAIMHDIAILQERTGQREAAIRTMRRSATQFEEIEDHGSQVQVLSSLAGAQSRGGQNDAAQATLKQVDELVTKHSVFPIFAEGTGRRELGLVQKNLALNATRPRPGDGSVFDQPLPPVLSEPALVTLDAVSDAAAVGRQAEPVRLLSGARFAVRKTQKNLTILDSDNRPQRIELDANAPQNLTAFYDQMSATSDVGLLMSYLRDYTHTIAFLPHVHFWVIPMAIGDCLAALGSYAEAEAEYLSTIDYKFLNQVVESVNLWLRLAELYLDWGDRLYRQARNDLPEFVKAKERYELLLRLNNSLNASSPLYKSPKFASMRDRANAVVQALFVNNTPSNENPRIQMALMRARMQLTKIANDLNFIGLGLHMPPFSFEYLQNLARYFAQHASQVEQMYIQFKSTGENEELRRAADGPAGRRSRAASVELEQRGLDEAAGRRRRRPGQPQLRRRPTQNAQQAANDFNSVRWELLELDTPAGLGLGSASTATIRSSSRSADTPTTAPTANAATWSCTIWPNQRTRISHDLEANRAAERDQRRQCLSRRRRSSRCSRRRRGSPSPSSGSPSPDCRQQYAQENLDFLTGPRVQRRRCGTTSRAKHAASRGRYLDMAIEVAVP